MEKSHKDILYKMIGSKVQKYLSEVKGIKQVQLAHHLDITESTLSNLLSGKRGITIHLLIDISIILGVRLIDLLPSQEELSTAFSEKQKNIEIILDNKDISLSDRNTILDLINLSKSTKDDKSNN